MRLLRVLATFMCAALALATTPAHAALRVVASIVPVHALAAAVMDGVAEPELLLKGLTSEHQAIYSPQQIEDLAAADLVFMIGGGLELKLDELSGSEAVGGRTFISLAQAEGVVRLPIRQGGAFAGHDHDEGTAVDDGHGEGAAAFDPHVWLDPENAKVMAHVMAQALAKADPEHAAQYSANAAALNSDLDQLTKDITADLSAVSGKQFVVQHDAYQYFERRFHLAGVGSISDFSASEPSAQRLKAVRDKVKEAKAVCVFREPQFSDRAAAIITEGTSARSAVLDGIGANLPAGPRAYRTLLLNLARDLKACLAG